jgi:hypothetical protein
VATQGLAFAVASGTTLTIGSIAASGGLAATAVENFAAGLYAPDGVTIAGEMAGAVLATADSMAFGIHSSGPVAIGSLAESGTITGAATTYFATGVYTVSNLTIAGELAGQVRAEAAGYGALGLIAGGDMSIGSVAETGSVMALTLGDFAYGLVAVGDMAVLGDMAGTVLAEAYGSFAVGMGSIGGALTIGSAGNGTSPGRSRPLPPRISPWG